MLTREIITKINSILTGRSVFMALKLSDKKKRKKNLITITMRLEQFYIRQNQYYKRKYSESFRITSNKSKHNRVRRNPL